jgi:hypothetical protein
MRESRVRVNTNYGYAVEVRTYRGTWLLSELAILIDFLNLKYDADLGLPVDEGKSLVVDLMYKPMIETYVELHKIHRNRLIAFFIEARAVRDDVLSLLQPLFSGNNSKQALELVARCIEMGMLNPDDWGVWGCRQWIDGLLRAVISENNQLQLIGTCRCGRFFPKPRPKYKTCGLKRCALARDSERSSKVRKPRQRQREKQQRKRAELRLMDLEAISLLDERFKRYTRRDPGLEASVYSDLKEIFGSCSPHQFWKIFPKWKNNPEGFWQSLSPERKEEVRKMLLAKNRRVTIRAFLN